MAQNDEESAAPARLRISATRRVTIPSNVLRAAGLRPGDVLEVVATTPGTVELRAAVNPYRAAAGKLTGVFPRGHLDELRDDWD